MADEKREEIRLEDGRKADRTIVKSFDPESREGVEVVETRVEPKVDRHLARRETKKTRPCVHERIVEHIDENTGEVVKKEIESIDPDIKLQVREQIVSASSLPQEEDSGIVSREELREDILDAAVVLAQHLAVPEDHAVSAQSMVEQRLTSQKKFPVLNVAMIAATGALIAGIVWVLFVM